MAVLVRGMDCLLCGEPIKPNDEVLMTPGFIMNEADPLVELSDAALHRACFERHPLAQQAAALIAELSAPKKTWPPICFICGSRVTAFGDFFAFGYLTDDPQNPLSKYRFKQAHKSCLEHLNDLQEVYEILRLNYETGQWTGRGVENLLSEIERAAQRKPK